MQSLYFVLFWSLWMVDFYIFYETHDTLYIFMYEKPVWLTFMYERFDSHVCETHVWETHMFEIAPWCTPGEIMGEETLYIYVQETLIFYTILWCTSLTVIHGRPVCLTWFPGVHQVRLWEIALACRSTKVRRDFCMRATWLLHTRVMTPSYMWHDSFLLLWEIVLTCLCTKVRRDFFRCVTWLLHTCVMALS